MRFILPAIALGVVLVGCNPVATAIKKVDADYNAALSDATNSIPFAADFGRLFPVTQSLFSYYMGGAGTPTLHMEAFLFDRYQMRMRVTVDFNKERNKVKNFGQPEFQLLEVAKVENTPDGGVYVTYDPDGHRNIGTEEWQRLVQARGDFSAIGYACVTNDPAPGFDLLRKDLEARLKSAR